MSFGIIAAGIGAAGALGSAAMQGSAAGDAADSLQAGSAASRRMYERAQRENDALLTNTEARNQKQYQPWDRLGRQGTRGLSRYLGYVPEYGAPKPTQPKQEWQGGGKGLTPASKKAQKQYKNKLAEWEAGRAAHESQQRGAEDFGDYFKKYGVEEPKYTPYGVKAPEYQEFTRADLDTDPIYKTELDENVGAWDKSAASRGSLMSGNTVAGLREITAGGISRARGRHVEDYGIDRGEWESNRDNYIEDYGIGHDEWEGGYNRDFDERGRKYNALTGLSDMGRQVADRRSELRTGTARDRVQNRQWGAQGASGAEMSAADARASGQMSQGTAWGNAFNDVGYLALRYGQGAFDGRGRNRGPTLGGYGSNKPNLTVSG